MVAGELEAIFSSDIASCKLPMFQYVFPPLMVKQAALINLGLSQSKINKSKTGVWGKEEGIQREWGRKKNVICVVCDRNTFKRVRLSKNKHKFKIIINSKDR